MVGEDDEDLKNHRELLPLSKLQGANDDPQFLGLLVCPLFFWEENASFG